MNAGFAAYIRQVRLEITIFGVQAVDSNSMAMSLQAVQPTTIMDIAMFADVTSIRMVVTETLRFAKLYDRQRRPGQVHRGTRGELYDERLLLLAVRLRDQPLIGAVRGAVHDLY